MIRDIWDFGMSESIDGTFGGHTTCIDWIRKRLHQFPCLSECADRTTYGYLPFLISQSHQHGWLPLVTGTRFRALHDPA
jgi:hypothetical protein